MKIIDPPLSFEQFSAEMETIWSDAVQKKQIKKPDPKNYVIEKCHTLYLYAYHGRLPFMVLGSERLCETPELLTNFGILTTGLPFCKEPISGTEMNLGAILSQEEWCVTLNDAYVFGFIKAGKCVHLYEPSGVLDDKSLWNEGSPRILGRELMMLKAAGYRRVHHAYPLLGKVFALDKSPKLSLKELIESAEKVSSLNEIRQFIETVL